MEIESFNLKSKKYKINFVPITDDIETKMIYKTKEEVSSYYTILNNDEIFLKISYPIQAYKKDLKIFLYQELGMLLLVTILNIITSIILAIYSLKPMKSFIQEKINFLDDISHDINTPIAVINLNTKMLMRKNKDKKLIRIANSLKHIENLQSNLMENIKEIDNTINLEKINLSEHISNIVDLYSSLYPNLNFIIKDNVLENHEIETDVKKFNRIIHNILSNSSKYTKSNGKIEIEIFDTSIIITDTGIGIKNTNNVFNRFYKEQERGLGLGLFIVKKYADLLNFKVQIQSEINKGTKVYIIMKNIENLK
jgi:two-component system OmpR family sensor kinase